MNLQNVAREITRTVLADRKSAEFRIQQPSNAWSKLEEKHSWKMERRKRMRVAAMLKAEARGSLGALQDKLKEQGLDNFQLNMLQRELATRVEEIRAGRLAKLEASDDSEREN